MRDRAFPSRWVMYYMPDLPVQNPPPLCKVSCNCAGDSLDSGAIMADSPLRPTAVVDCVIRLDGGDHVKLCEALEIFSSHVLRVLDAKTAVGFAMSLRDLRINVEDHRNGLIADRVRAELKAGGIGFHHAVMHQRHRMHFVRKNAVIVRLVVKRLEKIGGDRSERAVRSAKALSAPMRRNGPPKACLIPIFV